MTDLAVLALNAIRDYEHECNDRRREESQRIFGHPGASIPRVGPTEEGRLAAIREALAGR